MFWAQNKPLQMHFAKTLGFSILHRCLQEQISVLKDLVQIMMMK